jgi:hypothetical protein
MRYRRLRQYAVTSDFACRGVADIDGINVKLPVTLIINIIAVIVSLSLAGISIHKHKFSAFGGSNVSFAQYMPAKPSPGGNPPQISVIAPPQGAIFTAFSNITLSASVTADTDIAQVVFYAGDYVLGAISNRPYTIIWMNVPTGKYILKAKAVDIKGNFAFSDPVVFDVLYRPPVGCSCDNGCDDRTSISHPFVHNGAGEFCWQTTYLGYYVASHDLDALNINGSSLANMWTNKFPPSAGGSYYIYYKSTSDAGHFEMK